MDLDNRPRAVKSEEAETQAWTSEEAARFIAAAKKRGPQSHAFYALALETGMRKSELGGLRWANVDLDAGKVRVVEQLTKTAEKPEWGPTKSGKTRTVNLSAEMAVPSSAALSPRAGGTEDAESGRRLPRLQLGVREGVRARFGSAARCSATPCSSTTSARIEYG